MPVNLHFFQKIHLTKLIVYIILFTNAQAMTKLLTLVAAILFAQATIAQSLSPVAMTSAAAVTVKASKRMTASTGELTLRNSAQPNVNNSAIATTGNTQMDVYPNPAAGIVSFNFQTTGQGSVSVSLTNMMGEKISDLFAGNYDNGKIAEQMDISQVAPGMYFINLQYTDASGKAHNMSKKLQVL